MKKLHEVNDIQSNLERKVSEYIELGPSKLNQMPNFGNFTVEVKGKTLTGGWWVYPSDDDFEKSFIFIIEESWLGLLSKKYLAGFKIKEEMIRRLTSRELTVYD